MTRISKSGKPTEYYGMLGSPERYRELPDRDFKVPALEPGS